MRRWVCCSLIGLVLLGHAAQAHTTRPGVPVLIYHQIATDGAPPGETVIPLSRFAEQMRYLHEHGYRALSLGEFVAYLQGRASVPARSVVLTLDDGWRSGLNAVPVLEAYGMRASFWIITDLGIGGPYLEWSDIEALDRHPLFEVESHTLTHPWDRQDNLVTWVDGRVPGRTWHDALVELTASRRRLETRLGRSVRFLAWPCGWYNDRLIRLARWAGYTTLLTAEPGFNYSGDDRRRIKRLFIDGACGMDEFVQTLTEGRYVVCQTAGRPSLGHLPYD